MQLHVARADTDDAHALAHFFHGVVGGAEQAVEPRHQRLNVRPEQAALVERGKQVLHGEQGVNFRSVEPQAGQFELGAGARLVYLDCDTPGSAARGRKLYALLDAAGEVITVERRVRRESAVFSQQRGESTHARAA